jgi:hypothetical protein
MKVKEELAYRYCAETNFKLKEAVPSFLAGFEKACEMAAIEFGKSWADSKILGRPMAQAIKQFSIEILKNLGEEEVKE